MRKLLLAGVAIVLLAPLAYAKPLVFHYACKSEDAHYALTVNLLTANPDRGTVKMQGQGPDGTYTTFRILKTDDDCGRGGWSLNNGATFCYATQGYATLTWHGHDIECDQADTE